MTHSSALTPLEALNTFLSRIPSDKRTHTKQLKTSGLLVYATDGWALLSVPLHTVPNETILHPVYNGEPDNLKSVQALINHAKATGGELLDLPPLPDPLPCPECGGTGLATATIDCDECDGKGEFEHGRHIYECKECDGTGKKGQAAPPAPRIGDPCLSCDGRGEALNNPVKIGDAFINRVFLDRIAHLPNARIATPRSTTAAVYFSCEFGDGVVMPTANV